MNVNPIFHANWWLSVGSEIDGSLTNKCSKLFSYLDNGKSIGKKVLSVSIHVEGLMGL